jgi:hypothetical protein
MLLLGRRGANIAAKRSTIANNSQLKPSSV